MGESDQLLKDIFKDIDDNGEGTISRDKMFGHLKRTREIEFERKEDSNKSVDSSPKTALIPNFNKVEEHHDEKAKLIQELNTPLSLPGLSPTKSPSNSQFKSLPMSEIPEREVPKPDEEMKITDQKENEVAE